MLMILSRNSKSSSGPSLPSATSSGAKLSILKWVSDHKPIGSSTRPDHRKPETCMDGDHDHDHAALEKRFREALDLSCW
ncbi:hypothetical protein TIFTF001_032443 [Ficus carica]|uniref:Uncharacterized protein n=1 Tax=Ficus carica TaxID=3494 RepID=A0AA88DWC6_FICCA|nr:hypothetical protein TIFTF001_032443 [Ficus carica]